jgi:hypothetical protein
MVANNWHFIDHLQSAGRAPPERELGALPYQPLIHLW